MRSLLAKPKWSQSESPCALSNAKERDANGIGYNSRNFRYHYPFRFYLPGRGVFGQVDPRFREMLIRPSAALRIQYPYVMANHRPTVLVDPLGLWSVGDHKEMTEKALAGYVCPRVLDCIVAWNLHVDYQHPLDDELHGQGNLQVYNRRVRSEFRDAFKGIEQGQCDELAAAAGFLFHMYQDVNEHRGLTNFEHGALAAGSEGSRNYERRKENAQNSSDNLAADGALLGWWDFANENCCCSPCGEHGHFLAILGQIIVGFELLRGWIAGGEGFAPETEWKEPAAGMLDPGKRLFDPPPSP